MDAVACEQAPTKMPKLLNIVVACAENRVITLPWKALMQENHRLMPVAFGKRRRMILSPDYRAAMQAASILAVAQWKRPALKGSIALTVTIHEPDKRRRDIGNYANPKYYWRYDNP